MDVKVAANGRLILPLQARRAMGLSGDTKVALTIEGDVVRLAPLSHRVRRACELYRQAITQPRTTEDFLRERREEAAMDEGGTDDIDEPSGTGVDEAAPHAAGPDS